MPMHLWQNFIQCCWREARVMLTRCIRESSKSRYYSPEEQGRACATARRSHGPPPTRMVCMRKPALTVSLYRSTWKCVKWPCVSFLQTLPPSQSPRAMKRPRDDKPYSGARRQQSPRLISSGTEMTPGKTFSSPLPSSPFQVHSIEDP